jgi:hypothetical protein
MCRAPTKLATDVQRLSLQHGLNLKKFLYDFVNVNSPCLQGTVRDLIAKCVIPHDRGPRTARTSVPIKNKSGAIFERQTR